MDVFTFIDSTVALRTYFEQIVEAVATFDGENLPTLFHQIRSLGLFAEKEMFAATNGVNTHKGAIFSLGILVAAVAYDSKNVQITIVKIVKMLRTNRERFQRP